MSAPVLFQFMPPLLPSEYASLTESIRQHGIQVPVLVDENGAIIDGHHRDMIAAELGIDCPRDVRTGLTDSVKRTLAISLNKDRRHLTRAQVQALLEESVKADPQLSDREHSRRLGVSDHTVASTRKDLEAGAQIAHLAYRENPQGRPQPATKPERIDPTTGEVLEGTFPRPVLVAQTPRRRPITDAFWEAAYDLGKKAESLLRLVEDDRWTANRGAVADKNLAQMRETPNTLARVLAALTETSQGE